MNPHPDLATLEVIADLVAGGRVCILTGAGMSTESGIPDYRGPDGQRRVQPMQYSEFVAGPESRRRYWSRAHVGWTRFAASQPNAGHRVVAALQREGFAPSIITQNVDGLHQRAGASEVLELHGTLSLVRCLTCEDRIPRDLMEQRLAELNPGFAERVRSGEIRPDGDVTLPQADIDSFVLATCRSCGADTLKPDVVYFGENVPKQRVSRAYDAVDASDLLLVLGSSLQVMSGYRFVRHSHKARRPIAVITRGRTRGDGEATHRIDAGLGESLVALARMLGLDDDFGRLVDGEYATGLPLGLT
ncbi:NAD-dependent protein deacetylase [Mobilicoccus caccae]|uniref:protein acetyllysine N-acetyltransferase n=1 Tax=Mobilicoccus caccae TaxID=1859295 RepID=A0ABQ6ITP0_9MICO|nr:NAD-dependent protein deacetylase [Mobilicoccus caccae]GMA40426.1 NAD-dependent protein deacetylase [Mobilicoccus caccae]